MPRGKTLSDEEKVKIKILAQQGVAKKAIAREIVRSECVIRNFFKLGDNYGKYAPRKGNTKLTRRQKNQISLEATGNRLSAAQIVSKLDFPVTKRRVQQILKSSPHLVYKKPVKKPLLKAHHKEARLKFAKAHMHWKKEWETVIFSDEKKFNLDGPDGCASFWHDLRKDNPIKLSRNFQGGSVMVWGAFASNGKLKLCFIPTKTNSVTYTEMLEEVLIPFLEDVEEDQHFTFQQDNAAIHVSSYSRKWFQSKDIPLLEWPACSPDLNPIENLWGIMVRKIYQNGRQFHSVSALKNEIKQCWESLDVELLKKLINSMPDRIYQVINNNGKHTKY